jgi:hypothetical protein
VSKPLEYIGMMQQNQQHIFAVAPMMDWMQKPSFIRPYAMSCARFAHAFVRLAFRVRSFSFSREATRTYSR